MTPLKHAILPASSAERWLACPGCIRLCKNLPRTTNKYAEEGTAAHKLAEWCLDFGSDSSCNAIEKLGKTLMKSALPPHDWIAVTKEMAEAVQVYLDFIRATFVALPGAKMVIEHKFTLEWLLSESLWGTNDCNIFQPFGKMVVCDYKHGQGVAVASEGNAQLMYYALGALGADNAYCIEEVEIVVIQPRAPGDAIKSWKTTPKVLYDWAKSVLLPGAKLALTDGAPLKVGDHCKFCPALATCPAVREKSMEVAGAAFAANPVATTLPSPASLTTDQLERVCEAANLISDWATAAAAELRTRIERGESSTRFKIVQGKSSREWTDETQALDAISQRIDPWIKKMVSPVQAEDRLKDANIPKKEREAFVASLVTKKFGRSLVPIGDKRQALPPAGSPFEVVDVPADNAD